MSVSRLTESQREVVKQRLVSEGNPYAEGFAPWPEWAPKQHNACTDPCDMWTGPCACGAWHKEGR